VAAGHGRNQWHRSRGVWATVLGQASAVRAEPPTSAIIRNIPTNAFLRLLIVLPSIATDELRHQVDDAPARHTADIAYDHTVGYQQSSETGIRSVSELGLLKRNGRLREACRGERRRHTFGRGRASPPPTSSRGRRCVWPGRSRMDALISGRTTKPVPEPYTWASLVTPAQWKEREVGALVTDLSFSHPLGGYNSQTEA